LTNEDAIITDSLNHASIIDGIRLSKAERHIVNHLDINDFEQKLKDTQNKRIRLIVVDGVFSMDGDLSNLTELVKLKKKYNAYLFIDECHATGVLGKTLRGTPEHFNVMKDIDIINSTLGKALGGATGGYTTGNKLIIDVLRQKGRP